MRIYDGPTEVHKWVVARNLLGTRMTMNDERPIRRDFASRVDGHVALLEIDRPPHNHVSVDLMRDLADALEDVDAERDLRASVLTSAGKVFCAGADLASPTGVGGQGMAGINPLYVAGGAAVLGQEADRGRRPGRGGGRGPGPGAGGRLPRRRARGAVRGQLRQAGLPSRASASPTPCRGVIGDAEGGS